MTASDEYGSGERGTDEIRFDLVRPSEEGEEPLCSACESLVGDSYYLFNENVLCRKCHDQVESKLANRPGTVRFSRALLFGFGGAILGSILYFAVLAITGYEIGLIAIAVGWLVGKGVWNGSYWRGGWKYQVLAVGLTYSAIVVTYIPMIITALQDEMPELAEEVEAPGTSIPDFAPAPLGEDEGGDPSTPAAADRSAPGGTPTEQLGTDGPLIDDVPLTFFEILIGVAFLFVMAAALPVLAGFENIIGMFIIGIALWQAWTINRRKDVSLTGPFRVGPAEAP